MGREGGEGEGGPSTRPVTWSCWRWVGGVGGGLIYQCVSFVYVLPISLTLLLSNNNSICYSGRYISTPLVVIYDQHIM